MRKPLLLALVAILAACGRGPEPLAPELQAVRCPVNKAAHASGSFARGRVMFLCIAGALADSPHLLRCDLESRPMICEDAGSLVFSRGKDGVVYTSYYPGGSRQLDLDTMAGGSRLTVNFRDGPPRQPTFDEEETDWRFLYPEAGRLLPAGFEIVKGAVCDRRTSGLNSGTCNLEARSHSLYWHIAVSYLDEPDVEMTLGDYRAEMEFWLPFLGKLVTDPARKE